MSVYQDITALSAPYLGPAASQFIGRQCTLYLKIQPESLSKEHLVELAKWVEVSGVRFMDEAKAKDLATKIERLQG
jgi:hypothetical protein